MVRKRGDLTCSDNLPSRSQSGKKHGLPGLSMLLEKLSEKEKINRTEAYDKVQSILSQPLIRRRRLWLLWTPPINRLQSYWLWLPEFQKSCLTVRSWKEPKRHYLKNSEIRYL